MHEKCRHCFGRRIPLTKRANWASNWWFKTKRAGIKKPHQLYSWLNLRTLPDYLSSRKPHHTTVERQSIPSHNPLMMRRMRPRASRTQQHLSSSATSSWIFTKPPRSTTCSRIGAPSRPACVPELCTGDRATVHACMTLCVSSTQTCRRPLSVNTVLVHLLCCLVQPA